jgi:hypothetical protein
MSDGSVYAKRSEVKSPDLTSPDMKFSCGDQASSGTYVTREGQVPQAVADASLLTLDRRIASKIAPQPDGCWLWTASLGRGGYAQVWWGGTMARAHRVVYELITGVAVPADLESDHLCRVRHCVNPGHLEPVTRQENQRRRRKYPDDPKGATHARQRAWRERQRAARVSARNESGWWVSI